MFRWLSCAFISPDTAFEQNSIILKTLKKGWSSDSTGKKIQHINSAVGLGKSDSMDSFNNYLLYTHFGGREAPDTVDTQ